MKLALTNLYKMMDVCTSKQINFMVYMAQLQDDDGLVQGIRYDVTMEQAVIGKCTFYVSLDALAAKGLIEIIQDNEKSFWTVRIVDNAFKNCEDYSKGYINLNKAIFYSTAFKLMSKNMKKIVFHLFLINDFKKQTVKVTRETIKKWTNATDRSVRTYINLLSACFNVKKADNLLYIDCLQGFGANSESEQTIKNNHIINYRLRKAKCQSSQQDISDVSTLMQQFAVYGQEKIIYAIDKALKTFGTLAPAFINKAIRTPKN